MSAATDTTDPLAGFAEPTRVWFREQFTHATTVQSRGWPVIARDANALLVAPTGSGKTLAAFLWGIDRLASAPAPPTPGVRLLYISPLKALVYDVERNLRAPLAGIARTADRLGHPQRALRVDIRTGDTPQRDRQRQAKDPAEILVTTPESLFLLLGSKARATLATVTTVIVDEVHALAPNKRGAHLSLSLERLSELCEQEPQRIGLSATVRPLDQVAAFLTGGRDVEIVDASAPPRLKLQVSVPVPDMQRADEGREPEEDSGGSILGELYAREVGTPQTERGIWPAIYPELLARIREARSTIVFVNSRGLCERLCQRLNDLAEEELVRAHHGSVSHEKRTEIEEGLKSGELRAIVATSSLELGIDMGAVDQVLLVESPGAVSRGLQRVGRAGHQVGAESLGFIYPKFRGDLLECAVISSRMLDGKIEAIAVPRNALDVLAQQIIAICVDTPRSVEGLARLVRRAYGYHELSDDALNATLEMLSGTYPSNEFADLRPRLAWDRSTDELSARRGTPMVSRMNAGTIPDRGYYGVFLGEDGPRVGELDEEMVFETRPGDVILLGASSWRVESITRDRVLVSPAPGEPGRLPFWRGDGPGRPLELGRALGAFVREIGARSREQARAWVMERVPLDDYAADNIVNYVFEQREHTAVLPTDRAITVERFRDELGDWRVCILTPFGSRIHAPWAMALQQRFSEQAGFDVQIMYTDDGLVLRMADAEELPELESLLPEPEDVELLVTEVLSGTSMFASLFRENAVRSLLLARRNPKSRNPLWAQRLKSRELLAVALRYPSFPIVLETYRQAMTEVFDLPGLKSLLRQIRAREVQVDDVETRSASPFARSLVFAYVAAYLYEQDAPLAERKAQALTLDRNLLSELLGQAELRELLDPAVMAEVEAELQALTEERRARDENELHDLLRRLGDLTEDELAERAEEPAGVGAWLAALENARRAVPITLAGSRRWIAAEDAGLYRDALGCVPPPGLPERFIGASESPLEQLVRRYARTHGPFTLREAASRFDLRPAQLEPVLRSLAATGTLVNGELRPGGAEREWCDAEVLRRLKRRTLARLRNEVAAVDGSALARFLPAWHGIGSRAKGPARLLEAIGQLEGLALPWSLLSEVILPSRVPEFSTEMLDMLCASGEIVWVGGAPLGSSDGRVALYRRSNTRKLLEPPVPLEVSDDVHDALLAHLEHRGASFLSELADAARAAREGLSMEDFKAALWDLVWAGLVTNDTFAPLRGLGKRTPRRSRRGASEALAGGRWSLVRGLVDGQLTDTERSVTRARMLLDRYGVVSREAAQVESLTGGFSPIYRVLQGMEDAGRIRRGYFVEGLSGAQFAEPGAVDRLRAARADGDQGEVYAVDGIDTVGGPPEGPDDMDGGEDGGHRRRRYHDDEQPDHYAQEDVVVLASQDPANAYGSLLSWPETSAGEQFRPRRAAGTWVVLVDGRAVLWVGVAGKQLLTFADALASDRGEMELALQALCRLPMRRGKAMHIEQIDGVPAHDWAHAQWLLDHGFVRDHRGFIPERSAGAGSGRSHRRRTFSGRGRRA
jgi:ATP-dependent Lhr-like helicase